MPRNMGGSSGGSHVVAKPPVPVPQMPHKTANEQQVIAHTAVPHATVAQASMLLPGVAGLFGIALLQRKRRRG